jgi:outer membrane protein OmpA-like peptidoglycan-associated protein
LKRDDGRTFTYRIGSLPAGGSHKVKLDGTPGHHVWEGALEYRVGGEDESDPLQFHTVVAAPLKVEVDKAKVDLKKRRLYLKLNRQGSSVAIKVFGENDQVLADERHDISEHPANQEFAVRWSSGTGDEIVRIEVRVYDSDGFYNGVVLTPWSVRIPHEEVNFAYDSARIDRSEEPKLEDSLDKIEAALERYHQISNVKLFIAGHTDTKGSAGYNLQLSRRRAQAIAAWFGNNGLKIPIAYEGFGESVPKVKTGDEVDEPRNRRVDYILSVEDPLLKGGRAAWKRVK